MPRRITIKHSTRCRNCDAWLEAGTRAEWERGLGCWCDASCYRAEGRGDARGPETDPEVALADAERRHADQEYYRGVEDARRYQFNRAVLGQEEADRLEFEREVFYPDY